MFLFFRGATSRWRQAPWLSPSRSTSSAPALPSHSSSFDGSFRPLETATLEQSSGETSSSNMSRPESSSFYGSPMSYSPPFRRMSSSKLLSNWSFFIAMKETEIRNPTNSEQRWLPSILSSTVIILLGLFLISHVFKYSYYTPLKMLLNISFEAILTHVVFGDVSLFDMSFCVCTMYTNMSALTPI